MQSIAGLSPICCIYGNTNTLWGTSSGDALLRLISANLMLSMQQP